MTTLYQRHRPETLTDVAGHKFAMRQLLTLDKTVGLVGNAIWIVGASGTGKTTIARILASMVSVPSTTTEIDAQDCSMEFLRDIEANAAVKPLFSQAFTVIINEAHGLSSKAVSRLQTLLEDEHVSKNYLFLFTTTNAGQRSLIDGKLDSVPFLSRCVQIELHANSDTADAMGDRLFEIAKAEGLCHSQINAGDCRELIVTCDCNMRAALQRLATGELL